VRALVLGGSVFVGRRLVEALAGGGHDAEVRVVPRTHSRAERGES